MPRPPRFTPHAIGRLAERGIRRRWVRALLSTQPLRMPGSQVHSLTAAQLSGRFGGAFERGLRAVVVGDRVVTVHWTAS